jgi:phosphoribosyl 1,2-cyclic phosphodiesterase
MMLVAPLGSGSGGNCYYFESDGTRILVEAGLGIRDTTNRLSIVGRSIEQVQAIVVTHEHGDHIGSAEKIARALDIPIYLTRGTLEASGIDRRETRVITFENGATFRIGELNIHSCHTLHDAADPSCYVIEAGDGTRIGLATDLGYVDDPVMRHLGNCDGLLFESNHDLDMLRLGGYPWSLKRRIMSRFGHLSNDDSMAALRRLIGEHLKTLCLIHLSEKNNHESIVRAMASGLLRSTGGNVELQVARQREPIGMLQIARKRNGSRVPAMLNGQLQLF